MMKLRSLLLFFLTTSLVTLALLLQPEFVPESPRTIIQKSSAKFSKPLFLDQTLASGLEFSHMQLTHHLEALTETLGAGGCILDYDNDGLMDLFLVAGTGHTRHYGKHSWWHHVKGHGLFRNITQYADSLDFKNVSEASGFSVESWGMGCTAGDLNNDGYDELLITNKGDNLLYRNNTDGTFTDVTEAAGLTGNYWSTSAVLGDFDNDGLLDIYIANYIDFVKGTVTFEAARGFKSQLPEAFRPELFNAQPNRLYHNQGDFRFIERAAELAVDNSAGRSLSALWLDIDRNGYQDLLVVNDKGSPSQLFLNTDGVFVDAAASSVDIAVESVAGSHGPIVGDWDNTGVLDVVLTSPVAQAPKVLLGQPTGSGLNRQYDDMAWDTAIASDETLSLAGWGAASGDFNNDGWLDLLVNHGLVVPDPDTDKVSQGQGARLWLNHGLSTFGVPDFKSVNLGEPLSGRGAIKADFDNDGDLDIVLTQNNGPVQLLVNHQLPQEQQSAWLGVQLVDRFGNRSGVGHIVEVIVGENKWSRHSAEQSSFLSRHDSRYHFGLGDVLKTKKKNGQQQGVIDTLRVHWLDGSNAEFTDITSNQYIEIQQGKKEYSLLNSILDTKSTLLANAIGFQLPTAWHAHSTEYFVWKLRKAPTHKTIQEVFAYLSFATMDQQEALYRSLLSSIEPVLVSVAKRALESPSERIKLLSIAWFKQAELEDSVPWLINQVNDGSDAVVCASAETFEFFFHEEEAVVHRKYLSLSPLLRLLEQGSPQVKVCVLHALAESEHYRAVGSSMRLLSSDVKAVRIAAIRSLGRLRHGQSEQVLLALVEKNQNSVEEQAVLLIALSRLNAASFDDVLTAQFSLGLGFDAPQLLLRSADLVKAVIRNNEGVVIQRRVIASFVELLGSLFVYWEKAESVELLESLFEAMGLSQDPKLLTLLKPYIKHARADVRLAAYRALTLHRATETPALLQTGLTDQDEAVRNFLLDYLHDANVRLNVESIEMLAKQSSVKSVLPFLHRDMGKWGADYIARALNDNPDPQTLFLAFQACEKFPESRINYDWHRLKQVGALVRAAGVACQLSQFQMGITSKNIMYIETEIDTVISSGNDEAITLLLNALSLSRQSLAQKQLLKIVKSNKYPSAVLTNCIRIVAKRKRDIGLYVLHTALNHPSLEVRVAAIESSTEYLDNPGMLMKLWKVLENAKESLTVRLAAAGVLYNDKPDKVLGLLPL